MAAKNNGNNKNVHIRWGLLYVVFVAVLSLSSCDLSDFWSDVKPSGSLKVSISSGAVYGLRSLLPGISMDPAEYRISGSGPDGESFETSTDGEEIDIDDLVTGDWCISVTALNDDALQIGYGESYAVIEAGASTAVAIPVIPLSGTGSLSLSVTWPVEKGEGVVVSAVLTPLGGEAQSLVLETDACEASYSGSDLPSGYYTLNLQLLEGETVLAGVADMIRIVADASTQGSYTFNDLNDPTGDVEIIVTVDLDDPLEVSLSGVQDVLEYGAVMAVQAQVSNAGEAELSYTWYLNGGTAGTGETISVGADLRRGSYRLDVVVFTADGLRSGSATHSFTVE